MPYAKTAKMKKEEEGALCQLSISYVSDAFK